MAGDIKTEPSFDLNDNRLVDWSGQDWKPKRLLQVKLERIDNDHGQGRSRTPSSSSEAARTSSGEEDALSREMEAKPFWSGEGEEVRSNRRTLKIVLRRIDDKSQSSETLAKCGSSSDPISKCVFECTDCLEIFRNSRGLQKHLKKSHAKFVSLDDIERYLKKKVTHSCKACQKKILCDRYIIMLHLRIHKLNFSQYEERYSPSCYAEKRKLSKFLQDSEYVTEEISSKCTFRCPKCCSVFKSWDSFSSHLLRAEQISARMKHVAKYIETVVAFRCKLCSEKVLCDNEFIRMHALTNHRRSLPDFKAQIDPSQNEGRRELRKMIEAADLSIEPTSKCLFACLKCSLEFRAWSSLLDHYKKSGHGSKNNKSQLHELLKEIYVHICRICSEAIICDREFIKNHVLYKHKKTITRYEARFRLQVSKCSLKSRIDKAEKSEDISSKCHWKCRECNDLFKRRNSLLKHFAASNHGPKRNAEDLNLYLEKVVTHVCHECNMKLLCDLAFIASHLINAHGMNVSEYKSKFNIMSSTKRDINPLYVSKFLSQGTVSENNSVGNLCRFKCSFCYEIYRNFGTFRNHVSQCHHGITKYFEYKNLVKTIVHKCLMCSQMLLCDATKISSHMNHKHNLTLEQYCEKTGCKDMRINGEEDCSDLLEAADVVEIIDNLCTFKCISCDFMCDSYAKLRTHCKIKESKCSMRHHKKHLLKTVAYCCKICLTRTICDRYFIAMHVNGVHKQKMSEYAAKQYAEGYDKLTKWILHRNAFVVNIPLHKPAKESSQKPEAIKSDCLTANVGNTCKFACTVCKKEHFSWKDLSSHMRKAHDFRGRLKYHPSYVVEARYHKCAICSSIQLCDRVFIGRHVIYRHQTTLQSYETIVTQRGGEILPALHKICTVPLPENLLRQNTKANEKRP